MKNKYPTFELREVAASELVDLMEFNFPAIEYTLTSSTGEKTRIMDAFESNRVVTVATSFGRVEYDHFKRLLIQESLPSAVRGAVPLSSTSPEVSFIGVFDSMTDFGTQYFNLIKPEMLDEFVEVMDMGKYGWNLIKQYDLVSVEYKEYIYLFYTHLTDDDVLTTWREDF